MTRKILSLDGGGVRGLWSAIVLAQIERRIGEPLRNRLDLIAGTSTGGILGLLISCGRYTMPEVIELYREFAAKIFPTRRFRLIRQLWPLRRNQVLELKKAEERESDPEDSQNDRVILQALV